MMSTPVAIIPMNMTTIAKVSSLFADVNAGHSNLVIMHYKHIAHWPSCLLTMMMKMSIKIFAALTILIAGSAQFPNLPI